MRRATLFMLAIAAVLASCRAATVDGENAGAAPPTELGARPASGDPAAPATGSPAPGSPTGGPGGTADPGPGASPTPTGSVTPRPFRTIGSARDARGDGGLNAPDYADLRRVIVEDDGARARISVVLEDAVPNPLEPGSQMAIGVDLYRRSSSVESDYQVFATGTEEGWLAYFSTADGVIPYPGDFAITGKRLVFTVPWSAAGEIRGTGFSAFLDWDDTGDVLSFAGDDRTPDSGRASFAR